MKRKRYSEAQILGILKEAGSGIPVKELCRKHGFSDASFNNWRSKYGGMELSDMKRLKVLEQENSRLKKLLAETMLDKEALEVATVAPSGLGGHDGGGVARLPHGMPNYYEVWLRVAGCDPLIYMKASFTGRLFSVRDKGGCLKIAAAPESKVY